MPAALTYQFPLLFHPHVELIKRREQDEHREDKRQDDALLIAAEQTFKTVDRSCLRKQLAQRIHHGVVNPMEGNARKYAPGAVIHPAEQQTYEKGMGHLGGIEMDNGKYHCRYKYGHPRTAENSEQRLEDGAAEHGLLDKRNKQADDKIAVLVAHKLIEYLG